MQNWLILYDICDRKRLRRVAKETEQVGLRVQRSVFEAFATRKTIELLHENISTMLEPEDSVLFLPICEKDWPKRRAYGVGAKSGVANARPYRIL